MSHRTKAVSTIIIGILALVGAAATTASAQDNLGTPPGQLVVPPPATKTAPPVAATGKPQLVFEEMEHDFGKVKDDAPVSYEFKFANKGDGTLKFLNQPKASCGCTVPELTKLEYAPGEAGIITIKYNPQGKHGDANQRVTCATNDPVQPEQIVKIHAFVKTTIAFDPPLVSFGEVRNGEPAKQIVKVNGPAGDFKVGYASVSKGRYITVKVLDTKPAMIDGEEVGQSTLELTYNGNAPRGTLQAITTIRTNLDKYPLADVQVMAEVVGDLQVLPPRVNVGLVEQGAQFKKVFRVSSRSNKPFKITKIDQKSSLPSPLSVNFTPAEPGSDTAYNVEVSGSAPSSALPISATITIATDNASDKSVEVMLNGAVRAPAPAVPATAPGFTPAGPIVNPIQTKPSVGPTDAAPKPH
jgi:hypothetical protein